MDGVIKIGTQIDDKGFERDIETLSNKINIAKQQQDILNSETTKYNSELEKVNASIDESISKIGDMSAKMNALKQNLGSSAQYTSEYNELDINVTSEKEKLNSMLKQHEEITSELNEQEIKHQKINSQIEGYENRISKLKNKINEMNSKKIDDINNSMNNFSKKTDNIIGKVKRWALSLFSLATIYSLVSKASSSAMNLNDNLANAISGIWNYLGELVTPILETLIGWVLKALAVVNRFLYTLTGIDFAARMNSKALDKQAKSTKKNAQAQKELNKELAEFDEITNLQDESQNTNNIDDNISSTNPGTIELPELDPDTIAFIDKVANAVKKLWEKTKPLRDIIKEIIDYCLDHPDVLLGVLGGMAIFKIISGIIGVGSATNPVGLLGIAAVLLTIANIVVWKKISDELKAYNQDVKNNIKTQEELKKQWETLPQSFENCDNKALALSNQLKVLSKSVGNSTKAMAEHQDGLSRNEELMKKNIEQVKAEKDALIEEYNQTDKNANLTNQMITYLTNYQQALIDTNDKLGSNSIKAKENADIISQNKKEISDVDLQIQYLQYTLEGGTKSFEEYKNEINGTSGAVNAVKNALNNLNGKKATVKVDADTSQADKKANNWFKNFFNSGVLAPVNSVLGAVGLAAIPKLARGGIVNNPGKGVNIGGAIAGEAGAEAVFPLENSKFIENFADMISSRVNGGMTTDLLIELINAVNNLSDRPVTLNVNGQEIARATYQDFKNEENRINANTNIRRY